MWLVESKPIRSNVAMLTMSFSRVLCHHKFVTIWVNEYFLHKWCHVPCIMTSSIIPFPSILNIWRCGGFTALPLYQVHCHWTCVQNCILATCSICSTKIFLDSLQSTPNLSKQKEGCRVNMLLKHIKPTVTPYFKTITKCITVVISLSLC